MLGKIISNYQKIEMELVGKLSDNGIDIMDEAPFYDESYVEVKIERLKKRLNQVTQDLKIAIQYEKNDSYTEEKKKSLIRERDDILFHIVYWASNSWRSLGLCKRILEDYQVDFLDCINALTLFQENKEEEAFQLFHKYYSEKGSVENHYLINKTYGIILMHKRQDKMAIGLLEYALQFVPDDYEIYHLLQTLYQRNGMEENAGFIEEIVKLLITD
jgi:tetratricopeptide (TPR) repeat protein